MTTEARAQRYVFERELGRGGFGSVVLATDSLLGRRVALKSLSGQAAGALAGEARVLAALRHPNIVQVYDLAEIEGVPYLVLQYVAGRSLRSHLESASLPPERAVSYAVSIAAALAYAHQKGVVHNDVKPDNIMIGDDDEALLTDFGVASSPQSATLLPGEAGSIAGSLPYIAPEVIQGAAPSPRSDLYALAATLYEMLSGLPPFSGAGAAGMAQRLAGPPPRLTIRDSDWGALPDVLERALAPSATDRYQDAAEFASALTAMPSRQSAPIARVSASTARPTSRPPVGPGVVLGAAVALLGVALLGAAAVLVDRGSNDAGATEGQPGQLGLSNASATALAKTTTTVATEASPLAVATATPPSRPADPRDIAPGSSRGKEKGKKD